MDYSHAWFTLMSLSIGSLIGPCAVRTPPEFSFASYYGDHMLLQRAPQQAVIWGYAPLKQINNSVKIIFAGSGVNKEYHAPIRIGPFKDLAVWNVTLDAYPDGGPYIISALLQDHEPQVMKDVFFGDLWICSGQSNMHFTMDQMFQKSLFIEEGRNYHYLRLLNINQVTSKVPLYDFKSITMGWMHPGLGGSPEQRGLGQWSETFSSVCFMFGRYLFDSLNIPIGLIDTTWGGTPVECWSSPEALDTCGLKDGKMTEEEYNRIRKNDPHLVQASGDPMQNSILWNAMIHPMINMTIKGAIWYQGETNTYYHVDKYNCSFPAMITDWRKKFHEATGGQVPDDFPFGFVQIGPNRNEMEEYQYPSIRWHQMADDVTKLPLKNTFMAVAMDLTDNMSPYGAVHIRDKNTVAQRLSHAAINLIYNNGSGLHNFPYPTHEELLPVQKQLLIQFGLGVVQINVRTYDGFEACCSERYSDCPLNNSVNWVPSPIVQFNDTTIWISWARCKSATIAAYRYAWRETPCSYHQCAIYSDYSGDPLPTFTRPLHVKLRTQNVNKKQARRDLFRKTSMMDVVGMKNTVKLTRL